MKHHQLSIYKLVCNFSFLYFTRYHPIWRSYLEWWLLLWSHTISDHISNYQSLKGCSMHNKWYWWLMAELLINIERGKKQWHSLKWVSWVKKTLSLPSKVTQDPPKTPGSVGAGMVRVSPKNPSGHPALCSSQVTLLDALVADRPI